MRVAGSKSWRLTFDVAQSPHIALFARDALGIDCDGGVPRLLHRVPDQSQLIADQDPAAVATAWQAWWATMIPTSSQPLPAPGPALRRAIADLHDDACAWFEEHRKPWIVPRRDAHRDWQVSKSAAEAAASDRGVSPGDVHADSQLLLVDGNWWQRPAPGVLLYSPAVMIDEIQMHELLRATFASSVA